MAPMISLAKNEKNLVKINEKFKNERQKLVKLRKYIENNFENVGKNFSKKVREIYYDKKNNKTIYGTTTLKERQDLEDEGIDLVSIPWVEKEN